MQRLLAALCVAAFAPLAAAQVACPDKNLNYWQAFPPGGESDISARHQQVVLKGKCPAIDTIIQYKAGAGGGLMWSQMNQLPGDGYNIVVQLKQTPEAKPQIFRFTYDASICGGCKRAEYACTCHS